MFKKISILTLLATAFLFSCTEEDAKDPVYNSSTGVAPAFSSPSSGEELVLLEENASDVAMTVSWSEASFSNIDLAVTYDVFIDKAGEEFDTPVNLGKTTGTSIELTHSELDQKLFSAGYPADNALDFEIKVMASVTDEIALTSAYLPVRITLYEILVDYPYLNVPGDYQGWDPAGEERVYSRPPASDVEFEGFIYFSNEAVLFKYARGSWDENWGDDDADGTMEGDGANIVSGLAGMYKLNCDITPNAASHTYQLTNWGLIGSATPTGWDSDTDMIYDANTGYLTLTMDLVEGMIKFRANDAWDMNIGVDENGKFQFNGSDIPVAESGNYTINLILTGTVYKYQLIKN